MTHYEWGELIASMGSARCIQNQKLLLFTTYSKNPLHTSFFLGVKSRNIHTIIIIKVEVPIVYMQKNKKIHSYIVINMSLQK